MKNIKVDGFENFKPRPENLWRKPAVESTDIYPGLVVQDDRVGGSITVRQSRLPLWVLVRPSINGGWSHVQEGWDVDAYDFTPQEFSEFLYNLLESRGEFARLLLELANANREELHWWHDKTLVRTVLNQLEICREALAEHERTL